MATFDESGWRFEFPVGRAERFDLSGVSTGRQGSGLKWVDFVVETDEKLLFVEAKNYPSGMTPQDRGDIVPEQLVPKARDSYLVLHLMERAGKPIDYVVVLGGADAAFLGPLSDRLAAGLRHELDEPWKVRYVRESAIISTDTFNSRFGPHSVTPAS